MALSSALGLIKARLDGPHRVSVLFAVVLLAVQFTPASSQSEAAVSTCPDLRPVRVDSLRRLKLFNPSEIASFQDCYTSFNSTSEPLLHASTLVEATVSSYLVAVERLVQGDCSAGDRNESKTNTSSRVASTCSGTLSALHHLNRSREILKRWTSNCLSSPILDNSAQFPEAENVSEAHLSMCFNLLSSLVNETKAAVTACALNQSNCSSIDPLPLDSLLERFTSQACASIFFALANGTFSRLEFLEDQLRASFSIEETTAVNDTAALTVSQQAMVVLCHSAFPYEDESFQNKTSDNNSSSLRLCENACHRLRNTLNTLTDVLDPGKSPLIVFLREQTELVCSTMDPSINDCIDVSRYLTLFQRPSSSPHEQFCLNYTCHSPLRKTSNPNHWVDSTQAHLRTLFDLSRSAFSSATLPFNGSLLPCGLDCSSMIFTEKEESAARTVRSVMGFVSMFSNLVAIIAYFLNRQKLRQVARRLNVCLNIAYVVGVSSDMLLAGISSVATTRMCYSDKTRRMNEPNAAEGMTLCVFSAVLYLLCVNILFFVGISMSHEWYLTLSALGNLRFWESFQKNEKHREIVYFTLITLLSVSLTAVSLARQVFTGNFEQGSCSVTRRDAFYVISITFFISSATSAVYLVLGLPKLYRIYRNVRLVPDRTASILNRSNIARRNSTRIRGVESLLKLLSAYVIATAGTIFAIPLIYTYNFAIADRNKEALESHINCRLSRCRWAEHLCPSFSRESIALALVPEVYIGLVGVVVSAWAFSWSSYWKEHWIVLSMKMRQYRGTRAVWMSADPSPSNGKTLRAEVLKSS